MAETDFSSILESALTTPDSFIQAILPEIQNLDENKLSVLTNVLENGSVVDKQKVTQLFIEHLKEEGAAYLTGRLEVGQPKLFVQAANIVGELHYAPALGSLKIALSKDCIDLVLPAIKAISLLPSSNETIETLTDFFLHFDDEVQVSKSIRYLAEKSEDLIPVFLERYSSLPNTRKMFLLSYFSTVADPRTEQLIIDEYNSAPFEKGIYCIEALGRLGSDKAIAALTDALKSPEWFLRKHIVNALGISNNRNAVVPLLNTLQDKHVLVRGAAVKALSLVGNKDPELLIETLSSANKQVKTYLIRAMGQLKNEKFVESLVNILKERDLLFFSIDAVGDLGFSEGEFAIRRLLKDEVWFNRLNALEALEKLQSRQLKDFAQDALDDENDMVRNAASRILANIKAKQFGDNKPRKDISGLLGF